MGNSIALFVFEGEKQEQRYLSVFLEKLSVKIERIEIAWCCHIYSLYNELKGDPNLDTFELLTEKCTNLNSENYDRDDIARIYLFFDYDGHVPGAEDVAIKEMLETFNNETEEGKLFLSYPMLESLMDNSDSNFKDVVTEIELGRDYKQSSLLKLKKLSDLSKEDFKDLVGKHLKKANFLVNGQYENPDNLIEQRYIFNAQLNKYIPNQKVAVLSALPLFFLDYKGNAI